METLLLPFQFEFMRFAFWGAILLSVPMSLLSCFLILKGWSLMGDAVSHAVLPGIVLAYILGAPLAIGAFFAGLFCAIATGFIAENTRVKQDTVMGIVFSGMFAIGLVMYTAIQSDVHLDHILYGNILGLVRFDLIEVALVTFLVGGGILLRWRDLLLCAFDAAQAKAAGLPVRFLHYALLIALSMTIVSALKSVGIILAISFLIAPGAIAFLLTREFYKMMTVSFLVALSSSFIGVYASFFLNSAPAATIVLVMTVFFIAAFITTQWRQKKMSSSLGSDF
ncbi:MAG: metal ABC transporter permease [Paracoccaceae bacterium]|nr:metal ABC transporter permease [Paracoccaceae bacterium]